MSSTDSNKNVKCGNDHWTNMIGNALHQKWSFPLRISSVNVTKSAGNWNGKIFNGKFHFLWMMVQVKSSKNFWIHSCISIQLVWSNPWEAAILLFWLCFRNTLDTQYDKLQPWRLYGDYPELISNERKPQ